MQPGQSTTTRTSTATCTRAGSSGCTRTTWRTYAARPARASTHSPPPTNPNTTQNSLLFGELRDNMVIMNDGSFRAVIACKSINFDLMGSKEREGIEYSYQNFLNSLTFPLQILIRSQRVDIGPLPRASHEHTP